MRTSTAIYLIALAVFWPLVLIDIFTPGEVSEAFQIVTDIALYFVIGAGFYRMGADDTKKKLTKTYQEAA